MLTCLRISNFAIIDHVELELGAGMNVVTGETGAGKSILVTALQLVLGARANSDLLRDPKRSGSVEALFEVNQKAPCWAQLCDAGWIDPEDAASHESQEIVVRRVILPTGRTRAYINGQLTTSSRLAGLGAQLADIASQHAHHSLTQPAAHLSHLDAYAHLQKERDQMCIAFNNMKECSASVDLILDAQRESKEREDLWRFQYDEIVEVDPVSGELESFRSERDKLRHAESLIAAASGAEDTLYSSDGSLVEVLTHVISQVEGAAELDEALADPLALLRYAQVQIEDAAADLGRYGRNVSADPARLETIEDRITDLSRIQKKYGGTLEDVLVLREQLRSHLEELSNFDARLAEANDAYAATRKKAEALAKRLSTKRKKAATRLCSAINKQLHSLGMKDALLSVDFSPLHPDSGKMYLSESGCDRAEFLVKINGSEKPRALRAVASGGELSRLMLAIKCVLAEHSPGSIFVFDEVDAGVGGAVAEAIGEKIGSVAEHRQVLCITHLAQIAVYGQRHFRVAKSTVSGRAQSQVSELREHDRLEEVARMVGGRRITKTTRAAAAELLSAARCH